MKALTLRAGDTGHAQRRHHRGGPPRQPRRGRPDAAPHDRRRRHRCRGVGRNGQPSTARAPQRDPLDTPTRPRRRGSARLPSRPGGRPPRCGPHRHRDRRRPVAERLVFLDGRGGRRGRLCRRRSRIPGRRRRQPGPAQPTPRRVTPPRTPDRRVDPGRHHDRAAPGRVARAASHRSRDDRIERRRPPVGVHRRRTGRRSGRGAPDRARPPPAGGHRRPTRRPAELRCSRGEVARLQPGAGRRRHRCRVHAGPERQFHA